MPVALAATLVLAFTIILRVGTPEVAKTPEVTVQNVSRQVEIPAAAAPAMARDAAPAEASAGAAQANDGSAVVVDLGAGGVRAERDGAAETLAAPPMDARPWISDRCRDRSG